MDQIITRFPPSPTGYLHVGGARTALFNWLYARNQGGKFILRIEDTDTERSTKESVDAILSSLEWLEIDWDEGPFFQSQRFDIYKEYIQKLVDSGHAYYCTCSPEDIEAMRKKAMESGGKPKYDGTCREKNMKTTKNAAIRFKVPLSGTTVLPDIIKGNIVFQNTELDDFIIARSDGTPTYNLAVAIDDMTMNINTVIRGDDHVNNTPKQILIYKALKHELPRYGHVPMVLGSDRTRLSKRHGAMSVTEYRDMGYLPDAVINYLVRLGWSHGDQEFFTRDELIQKFNIENIGRSAGVFDVNKLMALNANHIQTAEPRKITPRLMPFLTQKNCHPEQTDDLEAIIKTLNQRSKTLIEMADGALFYFKEPVEYDEKAAQKFLSTEFLDILVPLVERIEKLTDFSEKNLENPFKEVMDITGVKFGKIAQPVRVALTGGTVSPGIFEMIAALGKKKTVSRLRQAESYIKNRVKS
ncbi:MAG: glutamate--tRNA ligase [Proteobacteria bacterium]|nr:glutamate--tRNA ligase [Pseudomonadota bacterium]